MKLPETEKLPDLALVKLELSDMFAGSPANSNTISVMQAYCASMLNCQLVNPRFVKGTLIADGITDLVRFDAINIQGGE